jgi:hypothetical protein
MKRMLLLISTLLISLSSAATIGGYGELHWDMEGESMDFHRFIIFYGHAFDDEWSMKAEVEIEHNMVGADYGGYLALEQAYLNYFNGDWGFKGGVVLAPVGIINTTHEPPTFLSVERPAYHKRIIPTTWFGNGMGFYGGMGDFSWEVTLMEDLLGDGILEDRAIRSGRGKGDDSRAISLTKIFSMGWTGMDGLRLGGSYTMNEAPTNDPTLGLDADGNDEDMNDGVPVDVTLMEINATYSKNNIHTVFEWATGEFDHPTGSWTSNGYYLDLGYNIGDMIGMEGKTLMPWLRMSTYTTDDSNDAKEKEVSLFGVTYKPNSSVSIKFETGESGDSDVMRMGVGYMF